MGSDLSYEDMMEERKLSEVYTAEIVNENTYMDSPVWIMQLTSKVEGLAYYKRILWIDKNKFVPLKENLYAKSGVLLKTTTFTNIKNTIKTTSSLQVFLGGVMMATGNKPPATVPAKAVYVMFERTCSLVSLTQLSPASPIRKNTTRMLRKYRTRASRSNTGTGGC